MEITERLLTVNPYSRPGIPRGQCLALVMHWTAAPMQASGATWQYFENRKLGATGYGSAHYIVGLGGEILRCIPEGEIAYHVGSSQPDPVSGRIYTDWARAQFGEHFCDPAGIGPNICTIGIEMEPTDSDGTFTHATLISAQELAADICRRLALDPMTEITTHNAIVGWKDCPRLWVNHPALLASFREGVTNVMKGEIPA